MAQRLVHTPNPARHTEVAIRALVPETAGHRVAVGPQPYSLEIGIDSHGLGVDGWAKREHGY